MTWRRSAVILTIVLGLGAAGAGVWLVVYGRAPVPAPPGIPITLARERAARISAIRYDLKLDIPPERTAPVRGRLAVSFSLADTDRPVAFDFAQPADRLLGVAVNGHPVSAAPIDGHINLSRRLKTGPNRVEFDFLAGDEPLNRSDDFMYTLFVPSRASAALPCFDQPDLKGKWTVTVEIPANWRALSNGTETLLEERGGRLTVGFAETPPLPTYLVSVVAGRFQVDTARRDGRAFRMFHRETDAARLQRNREAIFDLHARALAWLAEYTGTPFPFDKFDFVLIPAFQFTGMEHPGAVYYNANTLLLDESATQNQYLGRASVISHETAHMWFGNLVTMRWFDDVWMKEVFANLMAAKIVNPSFPAMNHEVRFLLQHYPAAYDVDRTAGANPIRQPLDNLNEAGSLYGAIIYQKAPIVMRQLERLMGPQAFRDGLREYLRKYAFGNAAWPDLVGVLDPRTPLDLAAWSRAWVETRGRPRIDVDLQIAGRRIERLRLIQFDDRNAGSLHPQAFSVWLGETDEGVRQIPVSLADRDTAVPEATGAPRPRWILPVGGYGLFRLDTTTIEYLSRSLGRVRDPVARASALVELWELMLDGHVAAGRLIDDLLLALPRESDELILQHMLDSVRVAYWRFTAADDRPAIAPRIEAVLKRGLAAASSPSVRAAWFDALRRTGTTPETVAWLSALWHRHAKIPGLPLSENDEAELAAELALRDVPDAPAVLQEQLERFKNTDRKARFAFVMPALSPDAAVRDAFFERLKDVSNRRREAWVLEAARYLHHPLRAASSKRYVKAALGLTWEIQRTGDIFFPKRWVDATLSGYQSIQTAAEVRSVIDSLPAGYPERLRWVLLASADPLFRAARLGNQ